MRSCGECTLCCTLTRVKELEKPEGVTCKHCDKGCKIYDTRPSACASYQCEWLKGSLPEAMRPDRSHVMIEVYPQMVAALVETGYSVSDLSPETIAVLDEFVAKGLPVIATGPIARLPVGMPADTAKHIMLKTVAEAGVM